MREREVDQRGLSLLEVLVATAILSVAIVVALTVYDASRKAFAQGENATEQQESVRIAFDLMTSQIRMLGLNVNPDGDLNRPDEPLEGALDRAIVFRGDFDRTDPAASVTPESTLDAGAFRSVSTGNDEIVAYVLSKPDGTGPDTITFEADVSEAARDGDVEPVSINNVVLDPTSPPYTLYRVTLNNDSAAYGGSSFLVRTPVVENVRDLRFTYYGTGNTFKDASATIPETVAAQQIRAGLTRVGVSLVGMTRRPDFGYLDPTDAAAPNYRKFELKGDVTPRNIHLKGIQDLNADVTPPTKPATPTLTPGHCGGLVVAWAPNPPSDGVTQYRVYWGLSSGAVSGSRNVSGSPLFLDGLETGTTYYVTVQAQDGQGNPSARSDSASATVVDLNTPAAPTPFTTTTNETYHVRVSWAPVTTNTAQVPSGDPIAPRTRDLAGYRLYWSLVSPFNPADASRVVTENVLGAGFVPPYLDTPLVACQEGFYRMTAVDTCGHESEPTGISRGVAANSGVLPRKPVNVQAQSIGGGSARVGWRPVSQDVADQSIKIARYRIWRSTVVTGGPGVADWPVDPIGEVTSPPFIDNGVPALGPGEVVYYRVNASDACVNSSDESDPAGLDCSFVGTVEFVSPVNGQNVSNAVPVTVRVVGGGDMAGATFTYAPTGDPLATEREFNASNPGQTWTDNWTPRHQGAYTLTATVRNASGCMQTALIEVTSTFGLSE